jgi:hypothetical protein
MLKCRVKCAILCHIHRETKMSAELCTHCRRTIDTDNDDTGFYADDTPWEYLCGACKDDLEEEYCNGMALCPSDEVSKKDIIFFIRWINSNDAA